ncbi:hypothetical protein D3C76_1437850 [compost metagenome]
MDLHLLGLKPGDFRRDLLIDGLELRACPDFAAVRAYVHCAVERLHGRMGQIRHGVFDIDFFCGLCQAGAGIAGLRGGLASGASQAPEFGEQLHAVQSCVRAQVPVDHQRIAAQLGSPVVVSHHSNACGHLEHLAYAGHSLGFAGIKGFG